MATEVFSIKKSTKKINAIPYDPRHCFGPECMIVDLVNARRADGENSTLRSMTDKAADDLQQRINKMCDMCKGKTR